MSTQSLHRKPGSKPRSFRVLALVASLSIAMAGLVGLGLAPAASAATCPDGYTLDGDLCKQTTDALPTSVTTYTCPADMTAVGWTSPQVGGEAPPAGSCSGTETVDKVDAYFCPEGFSPDGWTEGTTVYPGDDSCSKEVGNGEWVYKPAKETTTYGCGSNKIIGSDVGLTADKCYQEVPENASNKEQGNDGKWYQETGVKPGEETTYSCDEGWQLTGGDQCKQMQEGTKTIYRDPVAKKVCPTEESQVGPSSAKSGRHHDWNGCHDNGGGKCTVPVTADPIATPNTTWACPTDGVPAWTPDTVWNQEPTQPACSRSVTPGTMPPPTVTTTTSNCNDTGSCGLTCEQLGNCVPETPAVVDSVTVVAPEAGTTPVVAPEAGTVPAAKPAKPKPATVAAPEAATVPAAVPAGGGSQAPALPIWALALVAVGIIGAAAAGKQLVGARK